MPTSATATKINPVYRVEFFRHEPDAHRFIDGMIDDGFVCILDQSPLGFFVRVLHKNEDKNL